MHFILFSDKNETCVCKKWPQFFSHYLAEQTPQLFLHSDHTNRKTQIKV